MSKGGMVPLVLIFSSLAGCGDRPQLYYYTPEGYVKIANELIKKRAIGLVCGESEEHIEVDRSRMDDHEYEWFENSYLRDDVRRFNDGDHDLFLTQGCSLDQVNPYSHVVRLPEPRRPLANWLGKLFYAGSGVVGSLRSNDHTVAILKPREAPTARDIKLIPVAAGETHSRKGNPNQSPGGMTSEEARIAKFYFSPHTEEEAADVFGVGEETAVEELIDAQFRANNRLLVMGRIVPRGRVFALQEGDWMHFSRRSQGHVEGTTYLYTGSDLVRLLSSSSLRNNRQARTTFPNTLGFVDNLVAVMNDVTRHLSERLQATEVEHLDIELTVDFRLQEALSEKLAGQARQLQRQRPIYPVAASVAFADLLTGEILALPSYPMTEQDLAPFTYLSAGQRHRFLSNGNFDLHPVGSAIKPFWATATISRYPFLASMQIPRHGATEHYPTILGHRLVQPQEEGKTGGFETHAHPATDLISYLAVSCNKYLVDQTTLALGVKPECEAETKIRRISDCFQLESGSLGPEDRLSLATLSGRETMSSPPALPLVASRKLALLRQQPLFGDFSELTGALVHSLPAQVQDHTTPKGDFDQEFEEWYRSARYHLQPWSKLIRYLRQRSDENPTLLLSRFAATSPTAVNLAVNKVDRFRAEWTSMLLGGGTSIWNNVQIEEAMARLVSGRRVRSNLIRLLQSGRDNRSIQQSDSLEPLSHITDLGRRSALLGMSQVIRNPSGTGAALLPLSKRLERRFPDHRVYLFGKTGTPTVSYFLPPAADRLVTTLFNRRALTYDLGSKSVKVSDTGLSMLSKSNFGDTVSNWIRDMNRDLAEEGPESRFRRESRNYDPAVKLYLEGDLLRLNGGGSGQLEVKTHGGVFLLAAVLIDKKTPIDRAPAPRNLLPPQYLTEYGLIPSPEAVGLKRGTVAVGVVAYFSWLPGGGPQVSHFVASLEDELVSALQDRLAAQSAAQ